MYKRNLNKNQKILIVEDSITQSEKLSYFLEEQGYSCCLAYSGAEGLRFMKSHMPVLVISDVMMPRMNGYEFCKYAKADETLKNIPIILLTSLSDTSDILLGLECGADNFITKPYDEEYLLARVNYILTNRELRKQDRFQIGVEIEFGGKRHFITSERQQIVDLLISTYEQAVQINTKLKKREQELEESNLHLSALNVIGSIVNQSLNLDEILNDTINNLIEIINIDAGGIFIFENDAFILKANKHLPNELTKKELLNFILESEETVIGPIDIIQIPSSILSQVDMQAIRQLGFQFLMCSPLRIKGKVIGIIILCMYRQRNFRQTEIELIQSLSNQITVATENAQLYEITKSNRIKEQTALLSLSQYLIATFDTDAILKKTVETAKELLALDFCGIFLPNDLQEFLILRSHSSPEDENLKKLRIHNDKETVLGCVFITKEPICIFDIDIVKENQFRIPSQLIEKGLVSVIVIPVMLGNEAIGVLIGGIKYKRLVNDQELRLLLLVANQSATAFNNVRLYLLEQERSNKLIKLSIITSEISTQHEMSVVINMAVEGILKLFNTSQGGFYEYHTQTDELELTINVGLSDNEIPIVLEFCKEILKESLTTNLSNNIDNYFKTKNILKIFKTTQTSFIATPIKCADILVGILFTLDQAAEDQFSSLDLQMLNLFANEIGVMIQNAQAEKALRESEEKYRLLFEDTPQAMFVYDVETLGFLAVNDTAIVRYGYSREEFLSMSIKELRPPEDIPKLMQAVQSVHSSNEKTIFSGNWRHRKKDGSIIWVDTGSHAIDFVSRKARLVIATEITERKNLEEQLRQSQKMEAVGKLAGGIAHDFNNWLTAIIGFSQLALTCLDDKDRIHRYIQEIWKAGDHSAMLTRQLLAFSRKQILQPKILNINDVLINIMEMLRRLIGEDVELKTNLDSNLGQVKADPGQMEQIIINLVVNARDAMPNGGTLTIETSNIIFDQHYLDHKVNLQPGFYTKIAVSDTGCGIDLETQNHIFEPFFTTKEQGKGTGLGLSTVYGIINQNNGSISVDSKIAEGTTFTIYLPQINQLIESMPEQNLYIGASGGTETIILVEDDKTVRDLVCEVLISKGYKVIVAATSNEALSICESYKDKIDLLITDIVMPQMRGPELINKINQFRPDIKVLVMSGYTDPVFVQHLTFNVDALFLQKPFTPSFLANKVREILDQ